MGDISRPDCRKLSAYSKTTPPWRSSATAPTSFPQRYTRATVYGAAATGSVMGGRGSAAARRAGPLPLAAAQGRQLDRRDERNRQEGVERIQAAEGAENLDHGGKGRVLAGFRPVNGACAQAGTRRHIGHGAILLQPIPLKPATELGEDLAGRGSESDVIHYLYYM